MRDPEIEQLQLQIRELEARVRELVEARKVPDGDYEVVIVEIEEKLAQSGRNMWKFTFRITSGGHRGKVLYYNIVERPPDELLERLADAVGVRIARAEPRWADGRDPHAMIGSPCIVSVRNKLWQGIEYAEVRSVRKSFRD